MESGKNGIKVLMCFFLLSNLIVDCFRVAIAVGVFIPLVYAFLYPWHYGKYKK
jgi:hypothetical protein